MEKQNILEPGNFSYLSAKQLQYQIYNFDEFRYNFILYSVKEL